MSAVLNQPCDEGVIVSRPGIYHCPKKVGPWVLLATILGTSMAFVDSTVVNVALPTFQRDLNATVSQVQWIMESYALLLSSLILVGGSLGDIFGRRRLFAIGITLFALASIFCGLAGSAQALIFFRALQGLGAALLVPGSLAIISANFDEGQRGKAIGTWSGFSAITASLGPVLGGYLIEHFSWRWIFFINIPVALLVLVLLYWRVPESRDEERTTKIDYWGSLLATFGLGGVVYGMIESASLGWTHPMVVGSMLGGFVALGAFLVVESRSPNPMMPLPLFRSRNFMGANLLTFFLYGALGAAWFFFPFNLIQIQGYSATAAGAAFFPLIISIFLLSRWAGTLVERYGGRLPLVIGPLIAMLGFLLLAFPHIGGSYWATFFPGILVLGVGMGISVAPLTTVVMNAVEGQKAGVASGINNAVSRMAGLLAIAFMGVVVLSSFNSGLNQKLATLEVPPTVLNSLAEQRVKLAGAEVPPGIGEELAQVLKVSIQESFVTSFRLVMVFCAALALLSSLCGGILISGKKADREKG